MSRPSAGFTPAHALWIVLLLAAAAGLSLWPAGPISAGPAGVETVQAEPVAATVTGVFDSPQSPLATPTPTAPLEPAPTETALPTRVATAMATREATAIAPPEVSPPPLNPLPTPTGPAPLYLPIIFSHYCTEQSTCARFSGQPRAGLAPLVVTFTNSSTHASSYTWNYGDGSSLATNPPFPSHTHTYHNVGVYTVTLTAGNGLVTDTLSQVDYIKVYHPVQAAFSAAPAGGTLPLAVTFTNNSAYATAYLWDYGNGVTATLTAATHAYTYTQAGVYTVVLTASNPASAAVATRTVTVIDQPVAGLAVTNDGPTQLGGTTSLTSTIGGGSGVSYTWNFGDGSPQAPGGPVVAYPYSATGTFTAVVTASNTANQVTATTVVEVYEPAQAAFTAAPVSGPAPLAVSLTNTSLNALTSTWAYGDGQGAVNPPFPTHPHLYEPGTYTVSLTARGQYGPANSLTRTGLITAYRTGFSVFPPYTPLEREVAFFNNSQPAPAGCRWDFGDSLSSTVCSPLHAYSLPGVYSVTLAVDYGGAADTLTQTHCITVYQAGFSAEPVVGTIPLTVTFSNHSLNAANYQWDFGDGLTSASSALSLTHVYTSVGVYTASLSAWAGLGSAHIVTRTHYITVTDTPIEGLVATNDSPTNLGQPTTLTATITSGSNVTYTWNFGDGSSPVTGVEGGSTTVVTHTYPAVGIYTAVVTASNPAGEVTATTPVTISPICWIRLNDDPVDYPTVQAAIDASTNTTDVVKVAGYCTGVNTYGGLAQVAYISKTLTLRGGYAPTNWTTADPVANPTTLDALDQGRGLYITGPITPTIEGLRITGGNASGLGGYYNFATQTTEDAGGGVYITQAPATLSSNQLFSNTASYGGGLFLESSRALLDGNIISSNTATADYGGGGVYLLLSDATLTQNTISSNTGTGLRASCSNAILSGNIISGNTGGGLFWESVAADFSAEPLMGTTPLTVTFVNNSSGATDYLWSFGAGVTTTVVSPTYTYAQPGVYTVTLTATGAACRQTITRTNYITAYEPISIDFTASPLAGTIPLTMTFANSTTGATEYLWDFGDTLTDTVISPTHVYTQPGVYTVTLLAGNGVLTETLTRSGYITAYEPIDVDFYGEPLTGTVPLTITFGYSSTNAADYLWDFGDSSTLAVTNTLTGTALTLTHTYTQAGVYTVTLTAGDGQISGTVTRTGYITAYEAVAADFFAIPLTGTAPLTVTFANSSTGATSYEWGFGDSITSTVVSPTHVYTQPGAYTITLTAQGPGGTDIISRPAYIEALGAGFSALPQLGPAPLAVTFTDVLSDRVESRLWDFGDGITQSTTGGVTVTHIYTQAGVYSPTLTVVREGYVYTAARSAYLTARGAEFEAAPPSGLSPLSVTFTDRVSAPVAYRSWDFGDGSAPWITTGLTETTTSITATHLYTQTGVYSVTLVVEREGYTYTQTIPELILVSQPACGITTTGTTWWDGRFFYRRPISLTVTQDLVYSPAVTRVLALTLDTASLITANLMLPGGEDLRVVYRDGAGWRDLPRHLTGLNTDQTTVTFPLQATITDTSALSYYLYYGQVDPGDPPELFQDIDSGPTVTTSGTGSVTPTVAFTASVYAGLAPLNVGFTNLTTPTAGVDGYTWTFGDGDTSADFSPGHTYDEPGVYTVTLTAHAGSLDVTSARPAAIQVAGLETSGEATAELGEPETPLAVATICAGVPAPQSFSSADGCLLVTFPPGAVQETMVVTHTPKRIPGFGPEVLTVYDLSATTLSGEPVTSFNEEIALTLHYDDTFLPEWLEPSISGFAWNETAETWEYLPTMVSPGDNLATTRSSHFSLQMAALTGAGSARLGTPAESASLPSAVSAAQSDLFSGAATWAYPLHVPPGRNGLQPELALSYNSHLVDTDQTDFQKSGWLGLGFSLEPGFVELEMDYGAFEEFNGPCPDGQGDTCRIVAPTDLEAYLTLNGARSRLVGIDRDGDGRTDLAPGQDLVASFRLQQENFLRVELWQHSQATDPAATHLTLARNGQRIDLYNLYWRVTTKEGMVYRFGYRSDSIEVGLATTRQPATLTDLKWISYPGRAYLDSVTDLYHNTMTFAYSNESFSTVTLYDAGRYQIGGSLTGLDVRPANRFVRLDRIEYTYQDMPLSHPTRQVTFEYRPRTEAVETPPAKYLLEQDRPFRYYPDLLEAIVLSVNGSEFLRYELGYDQVTFLELPPVSVPLLQTITVMGKDEAGVYQEQEARTTLTYYKEWYDVPRKGRLHQIQNGYGGVTAFDYYLGNRRVKDISKTAPNTTPVIQAFLLDTAIEADRVGRKREVWSWSGVQEGLLTDTAATVTRYLFHKLHDGMPFDTDQVPLTGHPDRVEIFDPADIVLWNLGGRDVGPTDRDFFKTAFPRPGAKPLQSTCYEYDERLFASTEASTFVAPEKIITVFGDTCDSPGGIAVEYQYDQYGNVITMTERGDPVTGTDDRRTETYYLPPDIDNWIVSRPDYQLISGDIPVRKTDYDYSLRGGQGAISQLTVTQIDFISGTQITSRTYYDSYGNVEAVEDGKGYRTEIVAYDSSHTFPERVRYPAVNGTTFEAQTIYNPCWGAPEQEIGFNGDTTSYFYDPFGRPRQVTGPNGTTTLLTYDNPGSSLNVHTVYAYGTPDSYDTWSRYNGLGQLFQSETQGENGNIKVDYQYDRTGQVWRASLPYTDTTPTLWTETQYDPLGRPETITNPDGTVQRLAYTGWQQASSTLSREDFERQTVYRLDAFGRTKRVEQSLDGQPVTTAYDYDTLGHLVSITDTAGNKSHSFYDGLGRLREVADPDTGRRSYTYDANHNLATQTDALGQAITYHYDALNRPTGKSYSDGSPAVSYSYDQGLNGLGRRTGQSDPSGSTTWQYDQAGRVLTEVKTIDTTAYTTAYTYDNLSRVKTMTYPDGEVVTYGYDAGGQVNHLASDDGTTYLQAAGYNTLGQPTSLSLGAGLITTSLTYHAGGDHALALQSITARNGSGQLLNLNYPQYYADGSLKEMNGAIGLSSPAGLNLAYTYNDLGWLENVTGALGSDPDYGRSFGYDASGNLTGRTDPATGQDLTLVYSDTPGSPRPHAPLRVEDNLGALLAGYGYDANGSRTTETERNLTYSYDIENRLAEVSRGSETTTFVYDGVGQRVKRIGPDGASRFYVNPAYETGQAGYLEIASTLAPSAYPADDRPSAAAVGDRLYVTWHDSNIFTKLQTAQKLTETWTTLPASSLSRTPFNPTLAVNTDGITITIAWRSDTSQIFVRRSINSGTTWSTIGPLSKDTQYGFLSWQPALIKGASAGQLHLAWVEQALVGSYVCENVFYRVSSDYGQTWSSTPARINLWTPTEPESNAQPDLAVTSSGDLVVAWRRRTGPNSCLSRFEPGDVYVRRREAGGTWQSSYTMISEGNGQAGWPLIVARNNDLHVIWEYGNEVHYREWNGTVWSDIVSISGAGGVNENNVDPKHAIAVNSVGQVFVAWVNDNGDTVLATRPAGGSWSAPQVLVPNFDGGHISLIVDAADQPQVIQRKGNSLYQINIPVSSGTVKHYFANGQRIASRIDGELYYFLGDHLGSTTVVADAQGNEVGHVLYDPYGEVLETTLPDGLTDRLFTGYRWDDTIGLYDANARFYDPFTGNFTQPDSLVPEPYNPISLNRYAYVYNSPVNYTDSSGHFIDTLWDVVDLGIDLSNCLGDSDTLSCYMLPVDAAAVVVPFATGAGAADDALRAARGAERSSPVRIFVDSKGRAVPQYEEGTLFRVTAVTPDIDEAITRDGFRTPYARGVTEGQLSTLPPDAPLEDRIIEYVVPEGGGKFPRNANVIGLRADPGEAIRIAEGSGAKTLAQPDAYFRLDEIRVFSGEVVDAAAIFRKRGLRPKHPPLEGEFIFDGSIPGERIINTIRFRP